MLARRGPKARRLREHQGVGRLLWGDNVVAHGLDGVGKAEHQPGECGRDNRRTPESQLTDDGAGFQAMLQVVLPLFNLGSAAVALGICRAAVAGTATHLKSARFEHLGQSLGESLPTLRAQIATMQIDTDGLAARIDDLIDHLERPRDTTLLRVLESKAAAGDVAIAVTSVAMRICGGAAFAKHMAIERLFRDAHAGAVMAPTGDVLREFIGKAVLGMPLF
jgi:alkylation response protein AidB-like acyl-CoA dehydrogenase